MYAFLCCKHSVLNPFVLRVVPTSKIIVPPLWDDFVVFGVKQHVFTFFP